MLTCAHPSSTVPSSASCGEGSEFAVEAPRLLIKGRVLLDLDGLANSAVAAGTQNIHGIGKWPGDPF
jgi:hypothetical protein